MLYFLFDIDFTTGQQVKDDSPPLLSPLFVENEFQDFQTYSFNRLNKKWIIYSAFLLTIILEFIGIWAPFLFFQGDEWLENFPELAENGLYYLYLTFRIGPLSLFLFWFLFPVTALLLLIIELMIIFNALGNFPGLSLNRIADYLDPSIVNESSNVFFQKLEIPKI